MFTEVHAKPNKDQISRIYREQSENNTEEEEKSDKLAPKEEAPVVKGPVLGQVTNTPQLSQGPSL